MRRSYETVIGLEIHVQMTTDTKIFCGCSTRFGSDPNSQTCPVCLGLPGALPVLNKKAVELAIKTGLATDHSIAHRSIFARKNYFYPDLPKGYQISQFELPICENGSLTIMTEEGGEKVIGITRIHMEEDAGKLIHADGGSSLVDLNRACTPLIEIVSEPDMRSPEEAIAYLKKIYQIVTYLGVCDGNMEEGSFRCDANVSVRPVGQKEFGTRAELKNINSFRFVKLAIEYEVERQIDLIEEGGTVVQETRLYNADTGTTHSMRSKEEAHDYRYFPDPDLVPLIVSDAWIEEVRATLPELPDAKLCRFMEKLELPQADAEMLAADKGLADYFDSCIELTGDKGAKSCANWIMGELSRHLNESGTSVDDSPITPEMLVGILKRVEDGTISVKIGKTVFDKMWETSQSADEIIEAEGLKQVSDTGAIEAMIDTIIAANPGQAEEFRSGKDKLLGFFVGQVMKASRGKANPATVNALLVKKLKG